MIETITTSQRVVSSQREIAVNCMIFLTNWTFTCSLVKKNERLDRNKLFSCNVNHYVHKMLKRKVPLWPWNDLNLDSFRTKETSWGFYSPMVQLRRSCRAIPIRLYGTTSFRTHVFVTHAFYQFLASLQTPPHHLSVVLCGVQSLELWKWCGHREHIWYKKLNVSAKERIYVISF